MVEDAITGLTSPIWYQHTDYQLALDNSKFLHVKVLGKEYSEYSILENELFDLLRFLYVYTRSRNDYILIQYLVANHILLYCRLRNISPFDICLAQLYGALATL